MFLRSLDLPRRNAGHHIVLGGSDKRLLQGVDRIHRRHDIDDVATDLDGRRQVAGRLADYDGLDEIAHDRHQPLFDRFVGVVAGKEDQLENGKLCIARIELRLQLGNLLGQIFTGFFVSWRVPQASFSRITSSSSS